MSEMMNLEDLLGPDSSEVVLVDQSRREVWINGPICSGISRTVIRALRDMYRSSKAPLAIYINSEGGDPVEALVIADYMNLINENSIVETRVVGVSYSASVIISVAGKPGHRYALPSADFLVHELSISNLNGKISEIEAITGNLSRLNDKIYGYLLEMTNGDPDEILEAMRMETYMDVDEAIDFGLVDHVYDEIC